MTEPESTQQPIAPQPPKDDADHPQEPADEVEDASADSFPASDPPSFTESTATRNPGDD